MLQVKDFRSPDQPPPLPPEAHAARQLDPAMLAAINEAIRVGVSQAAESAHAVADTLIRSSLADVEARLANLSVPKPQILAIEVNGAIKTLRAPISDQSAKVLGRMIVNAKLGLNTMLVGPTGCGKTQLCAMLAEALSLEFAHISWTEGMSETASLFARQYHDKTLEAAFSKTFRNGGVFLNDELDKANPNAAGKLNMALSNGHFYNEVLHENISRHKDFVAVAACNAPRGGDAVYTATNRLSADGLNRFVILLVDYDSEYEKHACPHTALRELLQTARTKLRSLKSDEIISTRTLQAAYGQVMAGIEPQAVIDSMTYGWPKEIIKQCGLDRVDLLDAEESASASALPASVAAKVAANESRIEELKRKLAEKAGKP